MDSSKYKERVDGIVTNSLVAMAMGVGYRVGLFEAFRDIGQPCTSAQLVNHAHLKERYVQEWLGCMVAGEIIYINDENKYYFPVEVSWMLTQGYMASLLPIFGAKSPELINCMKENGPNGYSYNEYSDFNEWLDQERRNIDGKWIEEHIVPVTKMLKRDCINILDLGCGTGRLAIAVSKYFPNSSIYGIDESQKLITLATCNARNQSCKNVTFLTIEGEHMSTAWTEKFDLVIMLDVLHDLANPQKVIEEIRRCMKSESFLITFDPPLHNDHRKNVNVPRSGAFLAFSLFSCLPSSLSKEPYAGNGAGWGDGNRKQFLKNNYFKLVQIGDKDLEELTFRLTCKKL